jgi:hypothetical protein
MLSSFLIRLVVQANVRPVTPRYVMFVHVPYNSVSPIATRYKQAYGA